MVSSLEPRQPAALLIRNQYELAALVGSSRLRLSKHAKGVGPISRHYAELPLQGRQVEVMPKTLDLAARNLNDLARAQFDFLASRCEVLAGQLQRSRVYRAPG